MAKSKVVRVRCWVMNQDVRFFGPGPAQLMEAIAKTGSLAKAARSMKLSYKKAWQIVTSLNSGGSKPYIQLQKGGLDGGGAMLTPSGIKVLKAYRALEEKVSKLVEKQGKKLVKEL